MQETPVPNTTPIHWLDRARVAEARVAELEAALRRIIEEGPPAQYELIARAALGAVSGG